MSDITSESNLEIVHNDGTVTDKRDGIRRPYDEHIAHVNPPIITPPKVTEPIHVSVKPKKLYIGLIAGASGIAGAGIFDLIVHLLHH